MSSYDSLTDVRYDIYEFLPAPQVNTWRCLLVGFFYATIRLNSQLVTTCDNNFTKKRVKNGHFFSKETGKKRAELKNFMEKNGRYQIFYTPYVFNNISSGLF